MRKQPKRTEEVNVPDEVQVTVDCDAAAKAVLDELVKIIEPPTPPTPPEAEDAEPVNRPERPLLPLPDDEKNSDLEWGRYKGKNNPKSPGPHKEDWEVGLDEKGEVVALIPPPLPPKPIPVHRDTNADYYASMRVRDAIRPRTVRGHNILVVNAMIVPPEIQEDMARNADFGAAWWQQKDGAIVWQVWSAPGKFDVGRFATKYGGSGSTTEGSFETDIVTAMEILVD